MPPIPIPKRPSRAAPRPTDLEHQRLTSRSAHQHVPRLTRWRALLVVLTVAAAACGPANPSRPGTSSRNPSPSSSSTAPSNAGTPFVPAGCAYRAGGELPDSHCTPGGVDPRVTPDNIHQTICQTGYTATVRPPDSYTNPLKRDLLAAYGRPGDDPRAYELDHLVPLALGGAPTDIANLWPEPDPTPNPKDTVERRLQRDVCDGRVSLVDAQRAIAIDWRSAP